MIYRSEKEKAQDIADLRSACDIVRRDIRRLESNVVYAIEGRRHVSEIALESRLCDLRILQLEIREALTTRVTPTSCAGYACRLKD